MSPDRHRFLADVRANRCNRAILARGTRSSSVMVGLWRYALFQTVCSLHVGRAPEQGVKDYDIFYFDDGDLSAGGEARGQRRVDQVLGFLGAPIE